MTLMKNGLRLGRCPMHICKMTPPITVTDATHGELIRSKADIEVNPIIAYAGFGMRFLSLVILLLPTFN